MESSSFRFSFENLERNRLEYERLEEQRQRLEVETGQLDADAAQSESSERGIHQTRSDSTRLKGQTPRPPKALQAETNNKSGVPNATRDQNPYYEIPKFHNHDQFAVWLFDDPNIIPSDYDDFAVWQPEDSNIIHSSDTGAGSNAMIYNKELDEETVHHQAIILGPGKDSEIRIRGDERNTGTPICITLDTGPSTETRSIWPAILRAATKTEDPVCLPVFKTNGISDAWFPFPQQTLRRLISDPSSESRFLKLQRDHCFSNSWPDDITDKIYHLALEDGDETMDSNRILGEGAHGLVDEVTLSNRLVCVRKRIGRPRPLKSQRQFFDAFSRELNVMQQVDHHHCVRLLGSYTDFESVAILSLPIADMDLAAFLDLPSLSARQKDILYCGFGCLSCALNYLHQRKIRHEDLKPQNVLVHGDNLLLTDFGFSLDFSEDMMSTTTGRPSAWSPRYAAPEVLNFEPRNRASDVYSLGCIFIEMASAINGHRLSAMKHHWKSNGNTHISFAQNKIATLSWIKGDYYKPIQRFLKDVSFSMLDDNRLLRPTMEQVVNKLSDTDYEFRFLGTSLFKPCCRESINEPAFIEMLKLTSTLPVPGVFPADFVTYLLIDSDMKVIHSSAWDEENHAANDPTMDLEFWLQNRPDYNTVHVLQSTCAELLAVAHKSGETGKFWKNYNTRVIRSVPNGILYAQQSAKLAPLKYKIFKWIVGEGNNPPGQNNNVLACVLQVTLLPIIFERSGLLGSFFFQVSSIDSRSPHYRFWYPNRNKMLDFTTVGSGVHE